MNQLPVLPTHVPPPQPVAYPITVPKRTAHGFHVAMCVFTMGLWLPVYALVALLNAGKTETKWVTR